MTKYVLETGEEVDFHTILKSEKEKDTNHLCLISYHPLDIDHVSLACGHKFNYIPLYKEVIKQKTRYDTLNTEILKYNEIKCPYCRNKQASLLPPREDVEQIHGVNYIDPNRIPVPWSVPVYNKPVLCPQLLKTGQNKGKPCGAFVKYGNACCLRHKPKEIITQPK
jgi:hypothetical protein